MGRNLRSANQLLIANRKFAQYEPTRFRVMAQSSTCVWSLPPSSDPFPLRSAGMPLFPCRPITILSRVGT